MLFIWKAQKLKNGGDKGCTYEESSSSSALKSKAFGATKTKVFVG